MVSTLSIVSLFCSKKGESGDWGTNVGSNFPRFLESGLRSSPRRGGGARAPFSEQRLVIEPSSNGANIGTDDWAPVKGKTLTGHSPRYQQNGRLLITRPPTGTLFSSICICILLVFLLGTKWNPVFSVDHVTSPYLSWTNH